MGKDQHTSGIVESVTEGQSDLLVLATKNYPGGKEKLELAKGHTNFQSRLWELLDVLAGERVLQLPILERPIWKTILLGVHKNADEYRKAIKAAGGRISDWANDILGKPAFTVADQPMDIDLVVVTVAELGFPKGATRADIYKRAAEFELEPCPAEVGPALREQYMDQPNGEWLRIAMEPIVDSYAAPNIFNVEHDDDDLWLNYNYAFPGSVWDADFQWVFVRRYYLCFSPGHPGEFCLLSCPSQPPNIFPISSRGLDKAIYFLSSNDSVSHKIIKNTLSVSSFRMATFT